MRNRSLMGWEFYAAAPVVVAAIGFGLWVVIAAAFENYRLGQNADLLLRAVETARSLHIQQGMDPARASDLFIKQMEDERVAEIVQISDGFLGQEPERGFKNPWDEDVQTFFYPSAKAVRFETPLPAAACRRLLGLFEKAIGPLGLLRIDAKTASGWSGWRLVYERSAAEASLPPLPPEAIASGCGHDEQTLLSLTFHL